ncbi:MAG TPA: methyltransferase domain-containing protein [Vicinamibacterales bacterium]|nr:methyltransferase domain-containing protein [Vicinamibacterales bacterium]
MRQAQLPDELFESAAGMAAATNYADWTYSLFAPYVRGVVLEVGCGIGTFTRRLAAAPGVTQLLSIDISAPAVDRARAAVSSPVVEFRTADVRAVSGSFDLVVCMNVLEHIEDHASALRHMLNLVAPGGTLFLLVPSHQWLYSSFDRESGHWRRYSKRDMTALLADVTAGMRVRVRQFYFNTVGALGYGVVYKVLRKPGRADAGTEIGWFDRLVVPIQRRLEGRFMPFGISLVSIVTKDAAR